MKRLLFLLTFFVLTTSVKAQFVKPAGAVALPTYSFFYNTSDSTVTMYKGMTYTYNQLLSKWDSIKVKGYATNFKLLSYRQIRDTLTKDGTASNYRLLHKIDSIMSLVKYRNDSILPSGYASRYYVGANFTAKNDSSKLYKLKTDSTGTDGYTRRDRLLTELFKKRDLNNHDSLSTLQEKNYSSLDGKPDLTVYRLNNDHDSLSTLQEKNYSSLDGKPDLTVYRLLNNHDSLSVLDEKSYNSLTDKPSLSIYRLLNNHDSLSTLDEKAYASLTGKPDLTVYRQLNNHDSLSVLDEKSYNSLTDKPTVATFPLANDQWYPVYDYAGNLTNGWKKSKDNIFEFAGILGINTLYHVLNSGVNEIANIPLSTASATGTEHGFEMTVGGNKIMKVSAKVSATGTADSTRVTLSPGTKLGIGKNGTASVDIEAGTTTRAALKFTAGDTLTIRQPRTIGYKGISFYINDNLILSGKTTIGSTAAPTAKLMLGAGNTNANTAPQKFISGPLNTTPEVGAVEFLTDKWYGTITTGAARKTFAFLERPNFIDSIRTPVGRFTTGAGLGKIAKSDANGVLVWSDPTTYYLGTWNAATNTPTIADGTGTAGQWYRTVVKGVWGADSARVGSDVYYSGSVWQVIPNAIFFLQTMTKTVLGGGKMDSLTIKYNGSGQLMVDTADTQILGRGRAANTYEPKFVHNTGFNLNLGTTGGTVLEGRTFGTAANSATTDFVAYRTFGTAANNNTGDFQPMASILTNIQDSLNVRKAKNDSINVRWGYTTLYQNSLKANSSHNQAQSTITGLADSLLARYTKTQANTIYSTKVDKESGKHLPDNNFTDADSTAMANLAANLGAKSDTSTTGQHVRNITTAHGINNLVVKNDSSKLYERIANKVTSISVGSTDIQFPTAKLLYDQLAFKVTKNDSSKLYKLKTDSINNSGFFTNFKALQKRALNNHDSLSTLDEKSYNSLTNKPNLALYRLNNDHDSLSTLQEKNYSSLDGKPDLTIYRQLNNHDSLSVLDEKSYNSLTDKPNLNVYRLLNNHDSLSTLDEKDYVSLTGKPDLTIYTVKNDSSKYYKFRNDSILNSGYYTNYKASFLQLGLLNDTWLTAKDYAGNSVNLLKISKDNLLEFAPKVGINAFLFVQNPGFNYFADIPVSSEGAGIWHGTGIRVGNIDILKAQIYGLADSARIEVPSIKMTSGAGYRKIPISRNSLGWLKYSAAAYPDTVFVNRLMAGTSANVLGQLPLGTDRKILMGITDSVPKWKIPTTYDITPQGNRYFITPTDTIQLDNLASNLSAKVDKEAGKHLPDNNFTDADSTALINLSANLASKLDTTKATVAMRAAWTAKQSAITTGTTAQYFKGDLSLGTFPTALSNFTNDLGNYGSFLVSADIAGKLDTTKATYVLRGQWNTAYSWGNHASAGYVTGTPWTGMGYLTGTVSHTHGNITYDGAIGITTGLPIITTTSGVLTAGSFGTGAGTFCVGNDARLSDSRTASDVYAWAKAATKPSYTYSEVGAQAAGSYQATLVSATNIKTVNGTTLLGAGDLSTTQTTVSGNAGGLAAQYIDWNSASGGSSIANKPTIPTVNNATLTLAVSGSGLSGSQTFTANQSTAATFTVTSNATATNTASTIVLRDASGNVSLTGTFCTSDSTLKKNIKPLSKVDLYNASKIDFRKFNFKPDTANHLHFGAIAQDVKKLIPEVVNTSTETGKLEINYTEMLVLVAAQQKEEIKLQKEEIQLLKEQNRQLERRVKKLESHNKWEAKQIQFQ